MKNLSRDPSNLHWFLIMSVVLHLLILYLVPLALPTEAFQEEEMPKYQLVDFINLDADEGQIQPPSIPNVDKGEELAKEVTKEQVAKTPDATTPTAEPKPADKGQGAKGPKVDTPVSNPNLTAKDPKPAAKPEQKVDKTGVPVPAKTEPKNTTGPDTSKVVTSNNSDKVLEIPAEKTPPAKNPEPSNGTLPSTPSETGVPAEGQKTEEQKIALPTSPTDTLTKFVRPVYPKNAANENVEGVVELQVNVDTAGNIQQVKITLPSVDKRLDNVAFNTIKQGWKFKEFPYPYTLTVKVVFKASEVNVVYGELKFTQ